MDVLYTNDIKSFRLSCKLITPSTIDNHEKVFNKDGYYVALRKDRKRIITDGKTHLKPIIKVSLYKFIGEGYGDFFPIEDIDGGKDIAKKLFLAEVKQFATVIGTDEVNWCACKLDPPTETIEL